MKYNVGDRVRIKSLDWYNENKDEFGDVLLMVTTFSKYNFVEPQSDFCGKVVTIEEVHRNFYTITDHETDFYWTDEMIEGLVEEETKSEDELLNKYEEFTDRAFKGGYEKCKSDIKLNGFQLPEGYIFKDENGNVINATKIVLEKKKKEYPKTYEECCKVLNVAVRDLDILDNMLDTTEIIYRKNLDRLLNSFRKLLICRDAYWKIAGEEMGLGKPWEPTDSDYITGRYCIFVHRGNILCDTPAQDCILTFPTEEMRDAFYEYFKKEIEFCKELL